MDPRVVWWSAEASLRDGRQAETWRRDAQVGESICTKALKRLLGWECGVAAARRPDMMRKG